MSSDLLTDEDIEAFNNQADRVVDDLPEEVEELSRNMKGHVLKVILYTRRDPEVETIFENMDDYIILKIMPRHRFRVETTEGKVLEKGKNTFHRRKDAVERIEELLNV